jgi:multisubunit Na+/H+ antiporter MnhF subunit
MLLMLVFVQVPLVLLVLLVSLLILLLLMLLLAIQKLLVGQRTIDIIMTFNQLNNQPTVIMYILSLHSHVNGLSELT